MSCTQRSHPDKKTKADPKPMMELEDEEKRETKSCLSHIQVAKDEGDVIMKWSQLYFGVTLQGSQRFEGYSQKYAMSIDD